MTPEQQSALDKIKKLLRMKRGGTQAEVETALNLARELAEKHGIDLEAVNPEEEEQQRPIGHESTEPSARLQFESIYASLICQKFFNVEVFRQKSVPRFGLFFRSSYTVRLTFIGTDWDRQIAIYVYHFLVRHF